MNVRICLTSIQLQPTWICDDVVTGAETIDYFSVGKWKSIDRSNKTDKHLLLFLDSWSDKSSDLYLYVMFLFLFVIFFGIFFLPFYLTIESAERQETEAETCNKGLVSVMETQMLQLFTSRGPLMGIFNFWHFIDKKKKKRINQK